LINHNLIPNYGCTDRSEVHSILLRHVNGCLTCILSVADAENHYQNYDFLIVIKT